MNELKRILSLILVISMSISSINVAFADSNDIASSDNFEYTHSYEQGDVVVYDNGIEINGVFYTQEEFQNLLESSTLVYEMNIDAEEYENQYNDEMLPATGLVAGVYFIPGIGEVLITATGVVIVAGAVVVAGSWTYNAVVRYFKEHTKNKSKRTHDKHTKPRPGRNNEKKKQNPNWTPRNPRKKP